MRFSTKRNPRGLVIGEKIRAKQETRIEYDGDGYKALVTIPLDWEPLRTVVGVLRKATGTYIRGIGLGMLDYTPAHLQVDKYHVLYKCKAHLTAAVIFVAPEDVITKEQYEIS